jgi:hypothetical protein
VKYKFWPRKEVHIPNGNDAIWFIESSWVLVVSRNAQLGELFKFYSLEIRFQKEDGSSTLGDQSISVIERFLLHFSSQNAQISLTRFPSVSSLFRERERVL